MSNLGPAKQFLGLEIARLPDGSIILSQRTYIDSILRRFHMEDANSAPTPLHHKTRLDIDMSRDREADSAMYQAIVGSLMYADTSTRPDIAYAVAALSRYNTKRYITHMAAANRVLRYLKGTKDVGLVFPGRSTSEAYTDILRGYTDSDFAGESGSKVARQLLLSSTRRAHRLAVEETIACRDIDYRSRVCSLLRGHTQGPMPHTAA